MSFERENNLYIKSLAFAKEIVLLYRELVNSRYESEICKQVLKSGTSIGANISEAQGSISEADYISKIHIAYKELLETKYWCDLIVETKGMKKEKHEKLNDQINELSKILYTIIKKVKSKRS